MRKRKRKAKKAGRSVWWAGGEVGRRLPFYTELSGRPPLEETVEQRPERSSLQDCWGAGGGSILRSAGHS